MTDQSSLNKMAPYITTQTTLTVCCLDDDLPWCCNCFYVFVPEQALFYITTELTTRHGQLMINNPAVAGTITQQPKFIAKIKGVQFRGLIRLLSGDEAEEARALFCKRYPIARFHPAPMWEIALTELKMTNNALGFATKLNWQRRVAG